MGKYRKGGDKMNALEDAKHKLNLAICDSYGVPEEKVSDAVEAIVTAVVVEVLLLRRPPSPFVGLKPIEENNT
jgi:hypothetical protein